MSRQQQGSLCDLYKQLFWSQVLTVFTNSTEWFPFRQKKKEKKKAYLVRCLLDFAGNPEAPGAPGDVIHHFTQRHRHTMDVCQCLGFKLGVLLFQAHCWVKRNATTSVVAKNMTFLQNEYWLIRKGSIRRVEQIYMQNNHFRTIVNSVHKQFCNLFWQKRQWHVPDTSLNIK